MDGAPLIGFAGQSNPAFEAAFAPCVGAGWRLAAPFWGRGYATEAVRAALSFGFGAHGRARIVASAAQPDLRSHAVMRRLGMTRLAKGDFVHPIVPVGHRLVRHLFDAIDRDSRDQSSSMARMMPA